ncbi:BLUF domain-containing protein [Pedobacter ureilyticus]|uniref:BLUF domain-containing protein n=1 Tax=Pedobacter ureilyticus TaxID=1393051 RepID=A0ABW9J8Q0_9SPHI|nr:BLUF domain-containing protein [Pedobacter helvus]
MKKIAPSFYLVFTSRSSTLMSVGELNLILRKCYQANKSLNITGMLLYMEVRLMNKLEGRFIQLLEGNELQVQLLYDKICNDERHDKIFILASGHQKTARFNNWHMSYSNKPYSTRGYKMLDDKLFLSRYFTNNNGPAHFLKSFYNYNLQLQKEYDTRVAEFVSTT